MSSDDPPSHPEPAPVAPSRGRWQQFRTIVKVAELRLRFIALLAATGLVFAYWDTLWSYYAKWTRPPAGTVVAAPGTEFSCAMHPSVVQDEPAHCPTCGMSLSRRAKGPSKYSLRTYIRRR
jgi:membrane fusion protein, copper/silver efflux system